MRTIPQLSDFTEEAEIQSIQVTCSKSHSSCKVEPGVRLGSRAPEFMLLTPMLFYCKGLWHLGHFPEESLLNLPLNLFFLSILNQL